MVYYFRQLDRDKEEWTLFGNTTIDNRDGEIAVELFTNYDSLIWALRFLNNIID